MASSAQILANQKNALLSTGPKTPEGKSAAARNAVMHGLSGAFRVLANEDQSAFDRLFVNLRTEFAPSTEHEAFLVEQMAQSRWRLARIRRIEGAVLDQMLEGGVHPDPDRRVAAKLLLGGGESALNNLHRYASAAERSYYKAHKELMAARATRVAVLPAASAQNPERERRAPSAQNRERQRPEYVVQNEPNLANNANAPGCSAYGNTHNCTSA